MRKKPSPHSIKIREKAKELGMNLDGDHAWSVAEASMMETPSGFMHLHWLNRYGKGKWVFSSRRHWRICKTARCRVVYIHPMGGETCDMNEQSFQDMLDMYWKCYHLTAYPPSIFEMNNRINRLLGHKSPGITPQEWDKYKENVLGVK